MMTQSEFQALEKLLDRLTLQVDAMSADVGELKSGHLLIAQRLDSEKSSAVREADLIKQLAQMEAKYKTELATQEIKVKESSFNFHLRVLTGIVVLLAFASFPQLYSMWKAFKP